MFGGTSWTEQTNTLNKLSMEPTRHDQGEKKKQEKTYLFRFPLSDAWLNLGELRGHCSNDPRWVQHQDKFFFFFEKHEFVNIRLKTSGAVKAVAFFLPGSF